MKNKFKGFTLVELIVVLAIVAVLAGALIPSATYFIRNSKLKTANSQAKVVFNAALTVAQEYEAKNISLITANGKPSGTAITGDFTNLNMPTGDVQAAFVRRVDRKVKSDENDNDAWAVRLAKKNSTDTFPTLMGACYAGSFEDRYVGGFPHATPSTGSVTYKEFGEKGGNMTSLLDAACQED